VGLPLGLDIIIYLGFSGLKRVPSKAVSRSESRRLAKQV
jgi:hypothetical protein